LDLTHADIDRVVRLALAEDVGAGDVTTEATVPESARCRGLLVLEEPGIVAGLPVAEAVFRALDPAVRFTVLIPDGTAVHDVPATLAELEGRARAVLTAERTALNVVGRLCGIASLTRRFVDTVAGTRAAILDTRKTTPGIRALEKYAVRCGGGVNHRRGLDDAVLVKENHIRVAGGIAAAVAAVRAHTQEHAIEVEAETLDDVREALDAGVARILLDNMTTEEVAHAVLLVDGRASLEASGGISLGTIRGYAETGVDFISVGALTHSARSLHVSLEVE
jgi:nicotinate-nucleotide pyrophosphorylase (carboxylating)